MGLQKNMKFEKFWDKLQHLEEFKPKLIDLYKMDSGKMKLLIEGKTIWEDDVYSRPVGFETLSENKQLFGVSYRKRGTLGENLVLSLHSSRINLGFRPIHDIKIFRNSGGKTTISKDHFKKIWKLAKNLAKNHKDPFNQANYKVEKTIYDYHKGYTTRGGYTTPNHELEADGWKRKKRQPRKLAGNLSYIFPIMKHLLGDEIIE